MRQVASGRQQGARVWPLEGEALRAQPVLAERVVWPGVPPGAGLVRRLCLEAAQPGRPAQRPQGLLSLMISRPSATFNRPAL